MKLLLKSLLHSIFLFLVSAINAQEASKEIIVEIDTITRSAKTSAPFHAPFVLKVPVAEFPEEIRIYSSRKQNNLADMIIEEELQNEKRSLRLSPNLKKELFNYQNTIQTTFDSITRNFYNYNNINTENYKVTVGNATQLFLDAIATSSKDINHNKLKRKTNAFERKFKRFIRYVGRKQKLSPRKEYHFFEYQSKIQHKISTFLNFSKSTTIPSTNIENVKTEKEKYILIHFNDVQYDGNLKENLFLDPEFFYSLDFIYKDKRILKILDLQHTLSIKGDEESQAKFNNTLDEINSDFDNNPIPASTVDSTYQLVQSNFYRLDSILGLLDTCIINKPFKLNFASCCEDNNNLKTQLLLTKKINSFGQNKWNAILRGIETTTSLKSIDANDIDNRLKAISTSKTEFTELIKTTLYYSVPLPDSATTEQLICILGTLDTNELLLKKAQKEKEEITEVVTNSLPYKNNNLSSPNNTAKISTTSFTLDTRINRKLVADFGLGYYGNVFNNQSRKLFQGITPYLGISYSFLPLNKDIPFNKYPKFHKKLLRRFTLNLGYTVQKISSDERTLDMFDKGSLVVGVGFKLSHVIKINPSILVFYKKDTNPLSTRKQIGTLPYIGLSVDISLKSLFNGFSDLQTSRFL